MAHDITDEVDFTDKAALAKEYISSREYEDATRTVVKTIGREAGCDVVFAGDSAKAGADDKKQRIVVLPANDPASMMTKRQYFIGQGFANHETLHNLCTDLDGLHPRMKELTKYKQHLTLALANAIEDVRIEKAGGELYPGIPRKLDATAEFSAESFIENQHKSNPELVNDFNKIGPLAITWAGRKRLGYKTPSIQKCLDLLPKDILTRVEKYVDAVMTLPTGARGAGDIDRELSFKGSHMVMDMAEWIVKEERGIPDEDDEDKDKSKSGCAGKKPAGKGGDDCDSDGGNVGAGNSEDFIPQDECVNPDFLDCLRDELSTARSKDRYTPLTTALDVWVHQGDHTAAAKHTFGDPDNLRQYKKTTDKLTGKLAVMRRKLERALMSAMEVHYTSGHRVGKLDVAKKGVAIMSGKANVYRKREDGRDISAAVTLLIDASGSMSGMRIDLAQQAAIALAEAICRVGVPLEILVFNTRTPGSDEVKNRDAIQKIAHDVDQASRKGSSDERYSRTEPISMYEVKSFDDNMQQARRGMGAIDKMIASANADGESVLKAWDRLKKREEKNKVLLVLSDGQPSCGGRSDHLHKHLVDSVKLVEVEGGHCIGIGINSACVKSYYKKYSVIQNLNDLTGATIDNIARMLLGERFVVDNSKLMQTSREDAKKARV